MSPITPSLHVVEIDDDLLPMHHLLPHAAVVAAVAGAARWYQLRFDPVTKELRYLNTPIGPHRAAEVLRLCGQTVQIKVPAPRHRWVATGHALSRQYLTIAQLPLPGQVTALRSMVGRGGARYRVDLQINLPGETGETEEPLQVAGATFADPVSGEH